MTVTVDAAQTPRAALPPPRAGPRVTARRRRRRLTAVEVVAAVALIAILGAVSYRPAPAPLAPGRLWLAQAGPTLNALALAVAKASAAPDSPTAVGALNRAAAGARRLAPPPAGPMATQWGIALTDVSEAVTDAGARLQLLNAAGLAIVAVEVDARKG